MKKDYSTLKIQQEIVKEVFKEKGLSARIYAQYQIDNKSWLIDHIAINIDLLPELNISSIFTIAADYTGLLEMESIVAKDGKEMIIYKDNSGNVHKVDKKFLDLVNLDPKDERIDVYGSNKCIVSIYKDDELVAIIMEIK